MKIALVIAIIFLTVSGMSSRGFARTRPVSVNAAGRERVNFNADWRFVLGDISGAQAPDFDDTAWRSVGLPHSFSIPYFQSPSFYVGYGWYRKSFALPRLAAGRRLSLEFEGAFQDAEIFVNGVEVGHHLGGYTGFPVDITDEVHSGNNIVAVRINNKWNPTLAPRAGEHVFSGGLYRDVWLVATDSVHVPWTGTSVTTPDLSETSGRVAVDTEVRNDGPQATTVVVQTKILNNRSHTVASLSEQRVIVGPEQTVVAKQFPRL